MNGSDFYDLAKSLAAGSDPAQLRSATSRAYYGAYHAACELLRSCGIALPSGPESHTKVRWILNQSGDIDVASASGKLSSLRIARNNADYELSSKKPEGKPTVDRNLAIAKEVMDCIGLYFSGGAKAGTRASMRDYARDVLKLPVS